MRRPAAAVTSGGGAGDEGMGLRDLVAIFRRRRVTLAAVVVALTAIPTAVGLLLTPQYAAEATVAVDRRQARVADLEEVLPSPTPDVAFMATQIDVLRSGELVARAMERLGLFGDSELASAGAASEQAAREATIRAFGDRLRVTQPGEAYVLRVSYRSADPAKAAAVANALADLYVDAQLQEKLGATRKASAWLETRLAELRRELLDAERAAAAFRSEHLLVADEKGAAFTRSRLEGVDGVLARVRAEKADVEAKLRLAAAARGVGSGLDSLPEVIASPVVVELRRQEAALVREDADLAAAFGELHPRRQAKRQEMVKLGERIRAEMNRIVRGLGSQAEMLAQRERELELEFQAGVVQTTVDEEADIRLRELRREAEAKRGLYETLLARYEETKKQEEILAPDARVISRAESPSRPATPSPLVFAAVGFTASVVLGCLAALLREQLDGTLRSGRDAERALGAPCLGLVPTVAAGRSDHRLHVYLCEKPRSVYGQSVRALYSRLLAPSGGGPAPRVVLVASALPEEGKTSLAASLAACAARVGAEKTLLIDFDLWRPGVAREFRLQPLSGVAEVTALSGAHDLKYALRFDPETGMEILPAGGETREGSPAGQLSAERVRGLLERLRGRYERIILDSPPVLASSDAQILASCADATLYAVRWGDTDREAAASGLALLREAGARIVGVALTRVSMREHAMGGGDGLRYHRRFRGYHEN